MFSIFTRKKFDQPSRLEKILTTPLQYLAAIIYHGFNALHSSPSRPAWSAIRVVCISDTHDLTFPIPEGDVLIHAGDMTNRGTVATIQATVDWLSDQKHSVIVAIAGNHDTFLDPHSRATLPAGQRTGVVRWKRVRYLQNSGESFKLHHDRRLRIWGGPMVPRCGGDKFAFQHDEDTDVWSDKIPPGGVDILVTHTPPKFHGDLWSPWLGCPHLLRAVWKLKPTIHVFGHVHANAGRETVRWDDAQAAYEACLARQTKGFFRQIRSARLWLDVLMVTIHGFLGLVWSWVWGGSFERTIMVNASLMMNNSGELGNPVQVVDI
jgi:hypothetical protein